MVFTSKDEVSYAPGRVDAFVLRRNLGMASSFRVWFAVMVVVAIHRQDAACMACGEEAGPLVVFYLDSAQPNTPIPRGKGG